jgi:hypothetical protein
MLLCRIKKDNRLGFHNKWMGNPFAAYSLKLKKTLVEHPLEELNARSPKE